MFKETESFTKGEPTVESKTDVFSLRGLIAWLEKQPPEREYEWINCKVCMWGQYLAAHGMKYDLEMSNIIERRVHRMYGYISVQKPHTFAAALSRARQLSQGA